MKTKTEVAKQNKKRKKKKKKRTISNSTSFLLQFFLEVGPGTVGLQPSRILGLCLWGHLWQVVEELQEQSPS